MERCHPGKRGQPDSAAFPAERALSRSRRKGCWIKSTQGNLSDNPFLGVNSAVKSGRPADRGPTPWSCWGLRDRGLFCTKPGGHRDTVPSQKDRPQRTWVRHSWPQEGANTPLAIGSPSQPVGLFQLGGADPAGWLGACTAPPQVAPLTQTMGKGSKLYCVCGGGRGEGAWFLNATSERQTQLLT